MSPIARALAISGSLLASAVTAGCGGQMDPPAPRPFEISMLAIGGGQSDGTGFVPLVDGQDAALVSGAQGGFHVWLNLQFEMSSMMELPSSIVVERRARLERTQELVSTTKERRMLAGPSEQSGRFELDKAMPMFLCPAPAGIRVDDQALAVHVRIFADEHSMDALADGTIKVRPRCPEGDLASFCSRICGG
jgi:hypothetical protein